MVWLLHHAVAGHNDEHHTTCRGEHHEGHDSEHGVECPLCMMAGGLFLVAAITAPSQNSVLIAKVHKPGLSYPSIEIPVSCSRGPPLSVIL